MTIYSLCVHIYAYASCCTFMKFVFLLKYFSLFRIRKKVVDPVQKFLYKTLCGLDFTSYY